MGHRSGAQGEECCGALSPCPSSDQTLHVAPVVQAGKAQNLSGLINNIIYIAWANKCTHRFWFGAFKQKSHF